MSPKNALQPEHDPPTILEQVKFHSSDVGLCLLSVTLAVTVTATPVLLGVPGSVALAVMDLWVTLALAAAVAVGAGLTLAGMHLTYHVPSLGWTFQQAGSYLQAASWCGYSIAVLDAYPESFTVWVLAAGIGLIHLARALVVRAIEKRDRRKTGTDRRRRAGEQ